MASQLGSGGGGYAGGGYAGGGYSEGGKKGGDRRGGKPGGKGGGKGSYQVEWVDAGVYDSSLAGMLAPKPGTFTRNRDAFMDAPRTEGFIHKGVQWGGECAGCGEVGHQFSECMRGVIVKNGKQHVTWRELFKRGYVDGSGNKK